MGIIRKVSADGYHLWEAEFDVGPAAGTPCLLGTSIYCATLEGYAVRLDLETGREIWKNKFCSACSPEPWSSDITHDLWVVPGRNKPVQGPDMWSNAIYGLDPVNGTTRWSTSNMMMLLAPAPIIANEVVLFTSLLGEVYCLNAKDGSEKWKVQEPGSQSTGGVCVDGSEIYVTSNCRGKRQWNAPNGGKGRVRSFTLADGTKRWDRSLDTEANTLPCLVRLGGKLMVVVSLGANVGTLENPLGDQWSGRIMALDAANGGIIWETEPNIFPMIHCKGYIPGSGLSPALMTTPSASADGLLYVGSAAGLLAVFDATTGNPLEFYLHKMANHAAPVIGRDALVVADHGGLRCYRYHGAEHRRRVFRPLDRPFSETGTDHFWPHKMGCLHHTERSPFVSPTDISTGVVEFVDFEGHWGRMPGADFYHKTAVVDSQGNMYVSTNGSAVFVVRADGQLRGMFYVGYGASQPVLDGRSYYVGNAEGWAHSVDLETLETNWMAKYCCETGSDSWCPVILKDTLIIPGCALMACGDFGGSTHLYGLSKCDGSILWTTQLKAPTYNWTPSILEERMYFTDQMGGMLCMSWQDGSMVWEELEEHEHLGFSTGHCAVGLNRIIYAVYNRRTSNEEDYLWATLLDDGTVSKTFSGTGVVTARCAQTGKRHWTRTFEAEPGHVAPVVVPGEGGKELCVAAFGENPAFPPWQSATGVCGGEVYQGILRGFDGSTGADVWEWRTPLYKEYSPRGSTMNDIFLPDSWGSPSVDARGTLYISYASGFLYAFRAATGELLSQFDMRCSTQAAPVPLPGKVVCLNGFRITVCKDSAMEDAWVKEAAAAEDPRAELMLASNRAAAPTDAAEWAEASALGLRWMPTGKRAKCTTAPIAFGTPIPKPDAAHREAGEQAYKQFLADRKAREEQFAQITKKAEDGGDGKAPSSATAHADLAKGDSFKPSARGTEQGSGGKDTAAPARDEAAPPHWEVIGGGSSGGIVVRAAKSIKSAELGRLSRGARVEQIDELEGDRLHYRKLTGDGPDFGWMSLSLKGNPLVRQI